MRILSRLTSHPARTGLYLVLLAAVIRLLNILFLANSPLFAVPTSDELEHFQLASRLAAHGLLGTEEGLLWRPNLFAWVCAVAFKIFGTSFMVTHAVILVSDIAAVGLWYAAALRTFGKRAALISGLFLVAYQPLIHFSATGYMESFATALMAACAWLLSRFFTLPRRRWLSLAACGIFAGLAILCRPTLMLVMPFLALLVSVRYVLIVPRCWKPAILAPAILTVATLVAVSPNALRHWILFHKWVPMGVANEMNFHMGNNDDGWGWWANSPGIEFGLYSDTPTSIGNVPPSIDNARAYWKAQNRDYIFHHTGKFLRGVGLKFLQTWNRYEIHLTNNFREHQRLSPIEKFALPSWLIIPLGAAGLILWFSRLPGQLARARRFPNLRGRLLAQATLVTWLLVYTIGVALFLANTRHRLPAMPIVILFAGYGLVTARTHLKIYVPALAAGTVIAFLPVIPSWMSEHERWWTHINKGVALNNLNRNDEALAEFQAAIRVRPDKLEGWRQLAHEEKLMHGPAAAIPAQQQLVSLIQHQYPRYTAAQAEQLDALIVLQTDANQTSAARASLALLQRLAPDNPRVTELADRLNQNDAPTTATLTP